jgi:hypothetical protein
MNHVIKKAMVDLVSAAIITKNTASILTDTRNNLKNFTEVIVFNSFGATKNMAVTLTSNDWCN